jgi:predicted AlkP superfamily phosphohydrolase/phosphomutase
MQNKDVNPRTLVFGLDGFDFDYAQRLASRGLLPWLSSQLQQGSFVATDGSTLSGSEWVNAACGVSAAHHGYLHTSQLRLGTYEEVETDARVVRTDPFYVPLTRAGVRTIVVDLPVDRPRPHKNLLQVVDWGSEFALWHFSTAPRQLQKRVSQWCGRHPLTDYGGTVPDDATLIRLHQQLLDGVRLKGKLIRRLMQHQPNWQVFFVGFGEVHKAGHFFWQHQDPAHPDYPGPEHPLAEALVEQYQALDAECARICAAAGDAVDTLVVSERGMQANLRGDHLVPALLERWGLSAPASRMGSGSTMPAAGAWSVPRASLAHRIKERIPVALRPLVRKLSGRERADWEGTKVFQIPDVGTSYLRINVIDREPKGTVAAGAAYEALMALLSREIEALVNPATGRSAVAEIVYPQRTFVGPLTATLPDIGIVWSAEARIDALESPAIGRIEGVAYEQRSGNHTCNGGLLVAGPSFAPGAARKGDLRELAPTLLALQGVARPEYYEFPAMAELRRPLAGSARALAGESARPSLHGRYRAVTGRARHPLGR